MAGSHGAVRPWKEERSFTVKRTFVAGAVLAIALLVAACGSSSNSSTSSSNAASTAPAAKKANIAYLSFAVANSYDAPMLAAAQATAKAAGATLTFLDANNDPKAQFAQLQNATASGKYNAIIVQPIFGTGLITRGPGRHRQGDQGREHGPDPRPGSEHRRPQVKGLSGNVVFVPTDIGTKLGHARDPGLCGEEPQPVQRRIPLRHQGVIARRRDQERFDKATAGKIKVVAQGESFFTPAKGLAATQNMLSAHPEINLIVGSDQGIEGAVQAIGKKKIVLVGYGGAPAAMQGVSAGTWFGDVAQLPATEGRLAADAAVKAVRERQPSAPASNPVAQLPDGGVVTKDNVVAVHGGVARVDRLAVHVAASRASPSASAACWPSTAVPRDRAGARSTRSSARTARASPRSARSWPVCSRPTRGGCWSTASRSRSARRMRRSSSGIATDRAGAVDRPAAVGRRERVPRRRSRARPAWCAGGRCAPVTRELAERGRLRSPGRRASPAACGRPSSRRWRSCGRSRATPS